MVILTPQFGAWLRGKREDSGLSGYEVAKRLKIGARAYYAWENGERTPSTPRLCQVCSLLNVKWDDVINQMEGEHPRRSQELRIIRDFFAGKKVS